MAVIQTTNQKSEENDDVIPSQTQIEMTSTPIDSAIIQVTEVDNAKNLEVSIPDDFITEGCAIKRYAIWKQTRRLHRKVIAQIAMALFRNIFFLGGVSMPFCSYISGIYSLYGMGHTYTCAGRGNNLFWTFNSWFPCGTGLIMT